jgi:dihydrolipoamide dehydrogenase
MRTVGKAHVTGELDGLVKVVAEASSGRILGVHMLGTHAEDLIAEATLAVRLGLTLRDLADTIHPHPTMSEALWEAARAAMG